MPVSFFRAGNSFRIFFQQLVYQNRKRIFACEKFTSLGRLFSTRPINLDLPFLISLKFNQLFSTPLQDAEYSIEVGTPFFGKKWLHSLKQMQPIIYSLMLRLP